MVVGAAMLWSGATPVAAVSSPFTFRFIGYDNCVDGTAPANAALSVRLRAANGSLLQQTTANASNTGSWFACFDGRVVAGQSVRVTDGPDSRSLVIPDLTLVLDRATDAASGKAPTHARVLLKAFDCPPGAQFEPNCPVVSTRRLLVDSHGHYASDFSTVFDALGADYASLRWKNTFGDQMTLETRFPFMKVFLDDEVVGGTVKPGQAATFTLRSSPHGPIIATDDIVGDVITGNFDAHFGAVTVSEGDRLTATFATDAKLAVPADVSISWDDLSDTIHAHCIHGGGLMLSWFFGGASPVFTTADGTGEADVHLQPGDLPTSEGNTITMDCSSAAGDIIETQVEIPPS